MKARKRRLRVWHFMVLLLLFIGITVVTDRIRISGYGVEPRRPDPAIDLQQDELYYELVKDSAVIDWGKLSGTLEYISNEYDCSDFRLVNLVRILYDFGDRIPSDTRKEIEEVLFNFRYWWDEPGENSMCYWSENHQILFASAEYLVGQLYPEVEFHSGLTGRQHMEKARDRAMDWLQMRWDHGFIEFYSEVYYKEDIGALINLIDYAEDEELVSKSMIIMDLLFYDVATQSLATHFSSVSGRAYERNRKGGNTLGGLTDYYWGDGKEIGPGMMYGMMRSERYDVPPVLRAIALDTSQVVIRQSNGLDLTELKDAGYYGTDNRSMMMQWGMEAFTNPEVVRNSLTHVRACNMFSNDFLKDFKILDYTLLNWLHLEPTVVRMINPQTNGVAIQKGNTYTLRTPEYTMYTVQAHQVGDYGDQQHIFGMNLGKDFSVFHTHPAAEKDVNRQSPNYWVGYGHFPHSVQDGRVNLSIYNLPKKKGIMEHSLLEYTHAYFPEAAFDTAFIKGPYLFGRKGRAYVAMIGASEFFFRDEDRDDVIQDGKQSFWITEAGSEAEDGAFIDFVNRIRKNPVAFDPEALLLEYTSRGNTYELVFDGDFTLNGEKVSFYYPRYDAPYVQGRRKDNTIEYRHAGEYLFLDFENRIRRF